jgi:hypothetical protein
MLHLIYTVEVPTLQGSYQTHFVKWDDVMQRICVYVGGTTCIDEVAGGFELESLPNEFLYQVRESNGVTIYFRHILPFSYAEVAPVEPDEPVGTDDLVLAFLLSECSGYDPKYKSHLNDRKPHPKEYKYYYKSKYL